MKGYKLANGRFSISDVMRKDPCFSQIHYYMRNKANIAGADPVGLETIEQVLDSLSFSRRRVWTQWLIENEFLVAVEPKLRIKRGTQVNIRKTQYIVFVNHLDEAWLVNVGTGGYWSSNTTVKDPLAVTMDEFNSLIGSLSLEQCTQEEDGSITIK
jgi:hypothetical protein